MKFQRFLKADRQHCILKIVATAPQHKINEAVLETALRSLGHGVGYEEFLCDLQELERKKLLRLEDLEGLFIIHLSRRGRDAAENLIKVKDIHL